MTDPRLSQHETFSTPGPHFDEGPDYVNDLERQIRSEAVRALLADIDAALDTRQECLEWRVQQWAGADGAMALLYDRLASEVQQIRREIAEMGEK